MILYFSDSYIIQYKIYQHYAINPLVYLSLNLSDVAAIRTPSSMPATLCYNCATPLTCRLSSSPYSYPDHHGSSVSGLLKSVRAILATPLLLPWAQIHHGH